MHHTNQNNAENSLEEKKTIIKYWIEKLAGVLYENNP